MGTLYIVTTPIGNLDDITIRGVKTLFTVDVIACEDTRKTGLLLQRLVQQYPDLIPSPAPKQKLLAYHNYNEQQKTPEIVQMLQEGMHGALVSNAGTPLIADPGFDLVQGCIKKGITVVPVPGPSAFVAALSASGLPTDCVLFLGFLPKKGARRKAVLQFASQYVQSFRHAPTLALYETPHRLHETLRDIQHVFGDVNIVVARELTKLHEEFWRGSVSQASMHFPQPRGEFVILFQRYPSSLNLRR